MERFLKRFSTLPHKFISDFYVIAKEEYSENEIIINFDKICNWLNVQKGHLKEILIKHFEENYDYTIEKKQKKQKNSTGRTTYHEILITPNCFKELCMISLTPKAKEVRKYFIEMEKLIKRYYEKIQDKMYEEMKLIKYNQKPKTKIKGGIIYILRALNTKLDYFKIGKTKDLGDRLQKYNTGNANDIKLEFIIPVKDIDAAENCIKGSAKKFQYRHKKEVYEIDLNVLKDLVENCAEITDKLQKYYEKKTTSTKKILKRMTKEKYYIFIDKKNTIYKRKFKSKSKRKQRKKTISKKKDNK
jgi:phage anti-repressor protein